jgi:hypothetical protein
MLSVNHSGRTARVSSARFIGSLRGAHQHKHLVEFAPRLTHSPDGRDQNDPADRREISVVALVPPWCATVVEQPGFDTWLPIPLQSGKVVEHRMEAVPASLVAENYVEKIARRPEFVFVFDGKPEPFGQRIIEKVLPHLAKCDQRAIGKFIVPRRKIESS